MQNTLGTKTDRLGAEKVKKKKLRTFAKERFNYFKTSGTLKANCQVVQQQVGTEWGIFPFFIKFTHDRCTRDSDGHHSQQEQKGRLNVVSLKTPIPPHFYCSACLIYFPPSLWLVEFIGISLVIKSLVSRTKHFTSSLKCFTAWPPAWRLHMEPMKRMS